LDVAAVMTAAASGTVAPIPSALNSKRRKIFDETM